MKGWLKIALCAALSAGGASAARAMSQDAGMAGGYLDYAGGPLALGMGRAYVGYAEGTDAVVWNPAGLGFLRPNTINFAHTETVESAKLDYIGYAQPLYRSGAFGVAYTRLASGSIPQTDEFNRPVGSFQDIQQTAMLAYGISPIRNLSVGATVKFSQQSLADASANGYGMDLGAIQALPYGLSAGLHIQNAIAPALRYGSGTDEFPRTVTAGLAERLFMNRMAMTLDAGKDINDPARIQWRLGITGLLWDVARLLGGFNVNTREFSFGLGYLWGREEVNYASSTGDTGTSQRLGLSMSWGGFPVSLQANPLAFSPVGLEKNTTITIRVDHNKRIANWMLNIRNQNQDLVRSIRGSGFPPKELIWDGKTELGMMVPGGDYSLALVLTDEDGHSETTPSQIVLVQYGTPLDTLELRPR